MTAPQFIHDSDGVDFQALAARETMNHQNFVERIFERISGAIFLEKQPRKLKMSGGEIAVEPHRFVGRFTGEAALEIQAVAILLIATFFEERPEAAGVKKRLVLLRGQLINERDAHVDVAISRCRDRQSEFAQGRIERQQNVAFGKHAEGNSTDLVGGTVGNSLRGADTPRVTVSDSRKIDVFKQMLGIATMQFGGHRCEKSRHG